MCLFDGIDGVTLCFEFAHCVQGLLIILPLDRLFCAQRGLMDLLIRRTATDAAEDHALDTHRIGRAEDSPYVMLTTHVI